ncbi:TRAFs-binding domain-containing protein [Geomonas sp. RF6]|uniref:TRAFs-binding domain-containing protein n=1 Tax=Geomonas sp. RF6 TaxID=2897342 RepID=UPI001E35C9DA|nr:TRAFs-binding domain-containing protein [Geomonas sp. RF6]UFS72104.1 TRAFs-binding domain-containing protein [Geomonas sp. RF6]
MSASELRPIAFMVMPFRKRPVPGAPEGAPKELDCDALWDRAFRPVLEELGYLPVRADIEAGTVIVKDMLERLAFADLVLADMSLPNGNVYYEIGIRHVAKETDCVLVAAEWSSQLFDVDQMRTVRYPLKDGAVPDEAAQAVREVLKEKLPKVRSSRTPYYELIKEKSEASCFREQLETISAFQASVREARLMPTAEGRKGAVEALVAKYTGAAFCIPEVAFELLTLVRDCVSWQAMLDFVKQLPDSVQKDGYTKEQTLLAEAKTGNDAAAIAGLEELIRLRGDTPERRGLLGGRYKNLWRQMRDQRTGAGDATASLKEQGYLDEAIENYRKGMCLDLNEYYCVCNLPGLLRARSGPGDEEEAAFFDRLTVLATEVKMDKGEEDEWARPTLLGAAFRSGDVKEVSRLVRDVAREGASAWKLGTTLRDIEDAVAALPATDVRKQMEKYRDQLATLV